MNIFTALMKRNQTNNIIVYVAHRMTGRICSELVQEANMVCNALRNYGFEPRDPIIEENVPNVNEVLTQTNEERLKEYWNRDKTWGLQDCHIVLDYMSCNRSDGVMVELGISRFGYWKPIVRVFPNIGYCISRLEFDIITGSLPDALAVMKQRWGTKHKLLKWRLRMLWRCIPKFLYLQMKFIGDLI